MIKEKRWLRIEFYYCNNSMFCSEYAISSESSIIIVDGQQNVICKKDDFDPNEPYA